MKSVTQIKAVRKRAAGERGVISCIASPFVDTGVCSAAQLKDGTVLCVQLAGGAQ